MDERDTQVYMSSTDSDQIANLVADSVQSSCVARTGGVYRRRTIPRAVASHLLRTGLADHGLRAPASDLLLTSLLSGAVKMTSPVDQLTETGVLFSDGTCVDNVGAIICATGQLDRGHFSLYGATDYTVVYYCRYYLLTLTLPVFLANKPQNLQSRCYHWLSGVYNGTKFVFGRGCAQTPLGELTTLPRPPSRLGRGIPHPIADPSRGLWHLVVNACLRRRCCWEPKYTPENVVM